MKDFRLCVCVCVCVCEKTIHTQCYSTLEITYPAVGPNNFDRCGIYIKASESSSEVWGSREEYDIAVKCCSVVHPKRFNVEPLTPNTVLFPDPKILNIEILTLNMNVRVALSPWEILLVCTLQPSCT